MDPRYENQGIGGEADRLRRGRGPGPRVGRAVLPLAPRRSTTSSRRAGSASAPRTTCRPPGGSGTTQNGRSRQVLVKQLVPRAGPRPTPVTVPAGLSARLVDAPDLAGRLRLAHRPRPADTLPRSPTRLTEASRHGHVLPPPAAGVPGQAVAESVGRLLPGLPLPGRPVRTTCWPHLAASSGWPGTCSSSTGTTCPTASPVAEALRPAFGAEPGDAVVEVGLAAGRPPGRRRPVRTLGLCRVRRRRRVLESLCLGAPSPAVSGCADRPRTRDPATTMTDPASHDDSWGDLTPNSGSTSPPAAAAARDGRTPRRHRTPSRHGTKLAVESSRPSRAGRGSPDGRPEAEGRGRRGGATTAMRPKAARTRRRPRPPRRGRTPSPPPPAEEGRPPSGRRRAR